MPDLHPGQADYWESLAGTTGTLEPKTDYLRGYIADAIARGKPFVDAKREEEKAASVEKRVLSIQDRIRIASDAIICEIEEVVDDYIEHPAKFKKFDAIKFFRGKQVNQAHCKHIRNYYAPQLAEYTELTLPAREQDEDLREGYAHLSKADVKKGVELFNSIVGACDLIEAESKATRKTRTPKPKSADKLVAKMKYCKTDDKYKVASINPADIIDAKEVCGLDFGYNDPVALVAIKKIDKEVPEIYAKELLYKTRMTSSEIVDAIKENVKNKSIEIMGDGSRPEIIEDIRSAGINRIKEADRGKNSVKDSINYLKKYKLFIDKFSLNLIKEMRMYKWRVQPDGRMLDDPVDLNNHAIDALRYAAYRRVRKFNFYA